MPIFAPDYAFINCLWVSGKFSTQGNANILLKYAIDDCRAKGYKGLCAISSHKKRAFLSDKNFLLHKGFKLVDYAPPYFELLVLDFDCLDSEILESKSKNYENSDDKSPKPKSTKCVFKDCVKQKPDLPNGFVIFYTHQCPFNAKFAPILEVFAKSKDIPFALRHIQNKQDAQNAPTPFTTYSVFHDCEFMTHTILSQDGFVKIAHKVGYDV